MHIDAYLNAVLAAQPRSNEHVYMLYLNVMAASGADEYMLRSTIKQLVCAEHTYDLSPIFPVPFALEWMMPPALPTCNVFYARNVDALLPHAAVVQHVAIMLASVEKACKQRHPECGVDWHITYFLATVAAPPAWWEEAAAREQHAQ